MTHPRAWAYQSKDGKITPWAERTRELARSCAFPGQNPIRVYLVPELEYEKLTAKAKKLRRRAQAWGPATILRSYEDSQAPHETPDERGRRF